MHCSGCDNMPFWRWLKETQMYPTSITCNDFDGEFQTNLQPYSVIGCSGEYLCTLGFENLLLFVRLIVFAPFLIIIILILLSFRAP